MLVLYLDEFGHAGAWDPTDPRHRHHPLFGLAGIAIECAKARDLDRGYFRLKSAFYRREIEQAWLNQGKRAERFEPKQLKDRRDLRFAKEVLHLVGNLGACVVAHGRAKPVGAKDHSEMALYNSVMQGSLRRFDGVIAAAGAASGIIIADRRSEASDTALLASAQSYLFSRNGVRRVAETPLLVRSDWHHGVQAADTVGRVVAAVHRYRADGDQAFLGFEQRFGPLLDSLTVGTGSMRDSVYVGRRRRSRLPPGATPPAQGPT
jgi:hypothetical protein